MIWNYVKIGFRSMMKRRTSSLLNIFGLGLGISVSLVIWQYVEFESSYDNFHTNGDKIYRTLFTDYENGEKIGSSPRFGYGLGPALLQDLPEVASYVRTREEEGVIRYTDALGKEHSFQENKIQFVDSAFLDVFSYNVLSGSGSQALDKPSSIVITRSVASRYFGDKINPVGMTLQLVTQAGVSGAYEITAVLEDVPQNSTIEFDFLIPIHNLLQTDAYKEQSAQWNWVNFITYVMVHPNTSVDAMNAKTDALLTKYTGPNPPGTFIFTFQPLNEIHTDEKADLPFNSVNFYILIAIFILIIAWINFVNLSTARATERAREVGVKKAMGVLRSQLTTQFLVESFLFNLLSIVLGVVLAMCILPGLGEMVGKELSFQFDTLQLWTALLLMLLSGSLISGLYPAFILSSFKATDVIKGVAFKSDISLSLRKILTVFQFTASLLLIAGSFGIYKQISFMQQHEKGMNVSQMLIVDSPRIIGEDVSQEKLKSFRNELSKISAVSDVSFSGSTPGDGFDLVTGMVKLGSKVESGQRETVYIVNTDCDFIKTYDIKLLSGRNWNPEIASDHEGVLINEAALNPFALGDAEHALTEKLVIDNKDTVKILGVFKNAHWSSLHSPHVPMVLRPDEITSGQFSIHLNGDIRQSLEQVEQLYARVFPGNPFTYYFLDDFFNEQYKADRQFGKVFSAFTLLSVVIACLGFWSLASHMISQRKKEISIRKVLGASVKTIISLITNQFLVLVAIAGAIALPILWYAMNSWLNGFAFRIEFSWELYVIPMVGLLLVVLASVCFQTLKAAFSDPVNGLRSE